MTFVFVDRGHNFTRWAHKPTGLVLIQRPEGSNNGWTAQVHIGSVMYGNTEGRGWVYPSVAITTLLTQIKDYANDLVKFVDKVQS